MRFYFRSFLCAILASLVAIEYWSHWNLSYKRGSHGVSRATAVVMPTEFSNKTSQDNENGTRKERLLPKEYEIFPFCRGCLSALTKDNISCSQKIRKKNTIADNPHLGTQLKALVEQSPEDCGVCDPDLCRGEENREKFWSFGSTTTMPKFEQSSTYFLQSIPAEYRYPIETYGAESSLFVRDRFKAVDEGRATIDNLPGAMFEYNPTVARIPPQLLQQLKTDPSSPQPVYLASFRLSRTTHCFQRKQAVNYTKDHFDFLNGRNYLGLALMTEDLSLIQGTDVVINLEQELIELETKRPNKQLRTRFVSDFRLFTFGDEIYLNINIGPVFIVPITIATPQQRQQGQEFHRPPRATNDESSTNFDGYRAVEQYPYTLANIYGDGLLISLKSIPTTIWSGGPAGKNYALFGTNNEEDHGTTGDPTNPPRKIAYAEITTITNRHVQPIYLDWYRQVTLCRKKNLEEGCVEAGQLSDGQLKFFRRREASTPNDEKLTSTEQIGLSMPSFHTVDNAWFQQTPFSSNFHGGACCIEIDKRRKYVQGKIAKEAFGNDNKLLLGIAHSKIPWRRNFNPETPHHQYLSTIYAFRATPPFQIVARSGLFCLPFPGHGEDGHDSDDTNPFIPLTWDNPLVLKGREFAICPSISFVSGIVQSVGDPDVVIVSYGINDCVPRIAKIHKSELVRVLFAEF